MARKPSTARGTTPAGVFTSTYRWSYPSKPKKVWKALTTDIGKWWKKEFFGQASSTKFRLDPRLGAMMGESGPNGAGAVWGMVSALDPGRSILVIGHTAPKWGGPNTATMEFTLEAANGRDGGARGKGKGGSVLTLTHAVFGNADAKAKQSYDEGWNALFDDAMRKHLES